MIQGRQLVLVGVWCVLLGCTTAYRYNYRRQAGACHEELKQNEGQQMPPGYEAPTCDEAGNYKAVQCYGQWEGNGYCRCVKPQTGEWFGDIKGATTREQATHMTCRCAVDHASEADRAEKCDEHTGDYTPVVCNGEECHCAERWGARMSEYGEFNRGASNCVCARALSDVNASGTIGQTITCTSQGQFDPVQCTGSVCSCVDQNGDKFGETVFIGETHKLDCQQITPA